MTGNYFICQNRVVIEGTPIGEFQRCVVTDSREKLAGGANIEIPFYSVAVAEDESYKSSQKKVGKNVVTYTRINTEKLNIKCGSRIEVYAKYKDNETLKQEFDELKIFDGYIREIIGGFPTKLVCEDLTFPLRFGSVTKSWLKVTPIKDILKDILPIANDAFKKYRDDNGLSYKWPQIDIDGESADFKVPFKSSYLTSPFEIIERMVVQKMKLFANISLKDDTAYLFCGTARKDTSENTIDLSTALNVIERNITPNNGLFDNYRVIVTYNARSEGQSKVEIGSDNGVPYEMPYQGDNLDKKDMESIAENTLAGLKGNRNKGTITTLLYPKAQLFDYINFTDTIFTELSGSYAVIGYQLTCDQNGYHQQLTVTNKTFMYLAK